MTDENDIQLDVNTPHQSYENGIVERGNRTITGLVRSNMAYINLSCNFWQLAVIKSINKWNEAPRKCCNWNSLTEVLEILSSKLNQKFAIGQQIYCVSNASKKLKKLQDPTFKRIYMYRDPFGLGHLIWDKSNNKCKII